MANELLTSAAAERNKDPILTVLESVLPSSGTVLEIASGTGQHVCFFAAELPHIRWQPSEPDAPHRAAIEMRVREAGLTNVDPPIALDVHQPRWPVAPSYDAILCINMVHIAPWSATNALCIGAARHLATGGKLVLYGPYSTSFPPADRWRAAPMHKAFVADHGAMWTMLMQRMAS